MTKWQRIKGVLVGIVMMFGGVLMALAGGEAALIIMLLLALSLTISGIRMLIYYFSMARHMVGGKNVLFRGMVFLDLGVFAGMIFAHPAVYILIYISLLHIFTGMVSALRANESRKIGSSWRLKMAFGITNILLALIVMICGIAFGRLRIAVWAYSIGLIYSSVLSIISSCKHTEIVYIQ